MSLGLPRLREAFVKSLADLHNFYAAYFTNLWQEKVKEMNGNYLAMTEAINKLKRDLPQDVTIHLPNDIYSYQLFFLIIAMMVGVRSFQIFSINLLTFIFFLFFFTRSRCCVGFNSAMLFTTPFICVLRRVNIF